MMNVSFKFPNWVISSNFNQEKPSDGSREMPMHLSLNALSLNIRVLVWSKYGN